MNLPLDRARNSRMSGERQGRSWGDGKSPGFSSIKSGAPSMIFTGNPMWPLEGTNGFIARPNVVAGLPQKSAALLSGNFDPNRDTMFNPKAWKDPTPWTFGNGPRTYGNLRQFPYFNEDISIIKGTHLN